MIKFFVAGIPKTMSVGRTVRWSTKDKSRSGMFQERRHTDWATLIGEVGQGNAPAAPLKGALAFTAFFFVPRPVSLPKRETAPLKRPDLDNLMHKLTDAWNGVFWDDDSQIVDLVARKRFPEDGPYRRPGVEITIEPVFIEPARARQSELSDTPSSLGRDT